MQRFADGHENSFAFRLLSSLGRTKSVIALSSVCTAFAILLTAAAGWFYEYDRESMEHSMSIALVVGAIVSWSASRLVVTLASDLMVAREMLLELASRDELTQLYNRRYFGEQLQRALEFRTQRGESLGVLLLDVDRLKQINDTLGHHAGDDVLVKVAEAIRSAVRHDDLVARYAGDEFAVLLFRADEKSAREVSARIRASLKSTMENAASLKLELQPTLSIGVAICSEDESPTSLLRRADAALYQAKNNGRNVVAFAPAASKLIDIAPMPT